MANNIFIDQIAALCSRFGPQYNILVNSPVIAQAILESASGESELARNANNYFGIKFKRKSNGELRCPTALPAPYIKVGSEYDSATGKYVSSTMEWFAFSNMADSVRGYYDFINVPTYANLKGVRSYTEYCKLIKQDGYATSKDYTEKLLNVINKYNLTKYDNEVKKEQNMLKLALGAGHYINTPGKRCLKAIDPNETREWVLNDRICDRLEELLADYEGVQICRLDDTTGLTDVTLQARNAKASAFGADIYLSIHHNAGANGSASGGTQVYHYNTAVNKAQAQRIYDAVVAMTGLVGNRSQKVVNGNHLYECYAPSMASYILENGFMDSTTDTPIILTAEHAEKTAQGLLNFLVAEYNLVRRQPEPQPTGNFVPVTDLAYETPVILKQDTITALAAQYGKTAQELLQNNPGIYRIADGVYVINKDTVIYVG